VLSSSIVSFTSTLIILPWQRNVEMNTMKINLSIFMEDVDCSIMRRVK
jgi:hypothetical protein